MAAATSRWTERRLRDASAAGLRRRVFGGGIRPMYGGSARAAVAIRETWYRRDRATRAEAPPNAPPHGRDRRRPTRRRTARPPPLNAPPHRTTAAAQRAAARPRGARRPGNAPHSPPNGVRECSIRQDPPMEHADYATRDGLALAELVATREVTPGELLEVAHARARAVNPRVNAIVRSLDGIAEQRAAESLEGPFAGVPFLLKDLGQEYKGLASAGGCRALAWTPAAEHSTV